MYVGLYFPIGVALMTFIIGNVFLKETRLRSIWSEVDATPPT